MEVHERKSLSDTVNWHTLPAKKIFENVFSSETGLSSTEAFRRLKANGPNALPVPKPPSLATLFIRQFQSPLIYILLISSVVVYFIGDVVDSLVILGVLLINATIGVYQEGKAHNTLLALRSFAKTEAVVLRDGIEVIVPDEEVVVGDIVIVREGNKIPADARIIEAHTLAINESALTGESIPVSKNSDVISGVSVPAAGPTPTSARAPAVNVPLGDRKNMLFKGTFVTTGFAKAVVVTTGVNTVIGGISKQITSFDTEIPLKKDIRKLSRFVGIAVIVASAIVFAVGLWRGVPLGTMFFTGVAIAVSLIPEGLPIVITIILSSGAYRMAKKNALVKNLAAVEALGQANVIAVDKTGTITKNELMVEEVWVAGNAYAIGGSGYEPRGVVTISENGNSANLGGAAVAPANQPDLLFMGKIGTFCANAQVSFSEEEKMWHVAGDPTEAALLVFGQKVGFKKDELEVTEPHIAEMPFDSKLKYHLSLHKIRGKQFLTIVGAPEAVIRMCHQQWFPSRSLAFTARRKEEIEARVHALSKKGERVIAAAVVPVFKGELGSSESGNIEKAVFVGLFGMRDTLRVGVSDAVAAARARGLRVVMITGDHKVTAETIAREAGIFKDGDTVLTEKDLREMNEAELLKVLPQVSVFARIAPEEKLSLINLYRKSGDVVAMTGDGVNDALSLVAADLGVAMGKIGTEVSKEAADIVLLDDNFNSIVAAIDEGRNMYAGIKKTVLYLFSTGFGELFTVLFALLLAFPLPLFPTQILWLNLVTDSFLVFSLGLERLGTRGDDVARTRRALFDRHTIIRMMIMSLVMAIGSIFVFTKFYEVDFVRASTMTLCVLAVFQWFNAWNVRSEHQSIFSSRFFANPYLIGATVVVALLQIAAVYVPFMQTLLHTTSLSFNDILLVIGVSLTIIVVEELRKYIYRTSAWKIQNIQTNVQK